MSIEKINAPFTPIAQIEPKIEQTKRTEGGKSFSDMFNDAVKEVDSLQKSADTQIENMVMGQEGVTPHTAMIALEKADMAFQLMNNIRTKIIRAYEDVIRTQV